VRPFFVITRDRVGRLRCRRRIVGEGDGIKPTTIDAKVENVEAIVVADHIVKLFWLDATIKVDIGVENSFVVAQGVANLLAGWIEEKRCGARRGVEHGGGRGIARHQHVAGRPCRARRR
jgi:hypothetical protein